MSASRRRTTPRRAISLRLRLFLVILPPLFAVSILLGIWRFHAAQETSEELFDRSLLAAALATLLVYHACFVLYKEYEEPDTLPPMLSPDSSPLKPSPP